MDDNKEDKKKFNHADLKKPHYYGVMDGIHVFHGSHVDHKSHIGKHLENPSEDDFKAGLKEAKDKGLHMVYIHGSPPHSLRSQVHPELGAHVPGKLNKAEELEKMAKKKEPITNPQQQFWFKLKHPHAVDNNDYVKYEMHASDVHDHVKNYDTHAHHVFSHVVPNKSETRSTGAHSTAITREKVNKEGEKVLVPSKPIRDHVSKGAGKGKKILYFGCGHDYGGALALAGGNAKLHKEPMMDEHGTHLTDDQGNPLYHNHKIVGGDNTVHLYDKFHHDKSLTTMPGHQYDEVHSHYVFNVIDHATGKEALGQIAGRLKKDGKAIITARRDGGMKTNESWERLNSVSKQSSAAKAPSPAKTGKKPLAKAESKAKKPVTIHDLHSMVRDHAKEDGTKLSEHIFKIRNSEEKPKTKQLKPALGKSELKAMVQQVLKQIEEETVILTTKELAKGLISPEKNCQDCGCEVEGCICFNGFSEPSFDFDGKKLTVLFKNDWDEASKESYLDDFKRRAGRLIKPKNQ